MEQELEILKTIKAIHPTTGFAKFFGDRVVAKSKNPKWQEFPAHVLPHTFVDKYERAKHFKVYEDDVWLIGFPRSGTTLTQELLWILVNDFDFFGASIAGTYIRARNFEFPIAEDTTTAEHFNELDNMRRPRVFKTHLPVQFLPEQMWTVHPRIIHISREAKDVAVSHYHLRRDVLRDDVRSISEHFEEFLNDEAWFCPYRQHVMNYRNLPNSGNIFYMTYEELVSDMEGWIRKLASFLKKGVTDEKVEKLREHLRFENIKKNKMTNLEDDLENINAEAKGDTRKQRPTNTFIRKGIVGDHKNGMTEEMIKRFDEWMLDSKNIKS